MVNERNEVYKTVRQSENATILKEFCLWQWADSDT